jgi:hypothetical protein
MLNLSHQDNGQLKELQQYLESTFRMRSKMIDNRKQNPATP